MVALGQVAFHSILKMWQENYGLSSDRKFKFCHGGEWIVNGIVLLSSYHPSRQNTQTGRLTQSMFDSIWQRVGAMLEER